jgi:hypothetical protein
MFIKIYNDFEERNIEIINKIRIIRKIYEIKIDEIIKKIEMIKQITFMPPNESGTFIGGIEYHNAFQRYNQTIALID